MHWITLPSGKRINLALVFAVVEQEYFDFGKQRRHLTVYSAGHQNMTMDSNGGGYVQLSGDDIPAMLDAIDRVNADALAAV